MTDLPIRCGIEFVRLARRIPFARGYGRVRDLVLRWTRHRTQPLRVRRLGHTWDLYLHGHSHLDTELLFLGVYEQLLTNFVLQTVQAGWTCLDVGANVGYYTVLLGGSVGPQGLVVAFEPSARFRDRLDQHVALNRLTNVTVQRFGLSDSTTSATLYETGTTGRIEVPQSWSPSSYRTVDVELRRLDDYVRQAGLERIDFIKVDIDGHEPAFLTGARETLERFHPVLVIEVMPENAKVVAQTLLELRYRLTTECGAAIESADQLVEFLRSRAGTNLFCRA